MDGTVRVLAACFFLWLAPLQAQSGIPEPLRLNIPFQAAWEGIIAVLDDKDLKIEQTDRAKGRILTEDREYSSGPLTTSHISKIGIRPKLPDGDWVLVKYQLEIEVQLIESRLTVVGASAIIKALKRNFLGGESWVDIPSNGELESDFLTAFGKHLFGESFRLAEPKKGFWDRSPRPVPEGDERRPRVVGPERPPG